MYCRELAPGTASLTGDRVRGDNSGQNSYYTVFIFWAIYDPISIDMHAYLNQETNAPTKSGYTCYCCVCFMIFVNKIVLEGSAPMHLEKKKRLFYECKNDNRICNMCYHYVNISVPLKPL